MAITYSDSNIHWNYYLAIEEDFKRISRFVEFSEANNEVYSIEFARLLMSATQEVEIVIKKLHELIGGLNRMKDIGDYIAFINSNLSEMKDEYVSIPRFGMRSKPWANLVTDEVPLWWTANNKIKHQRNTNFHEAKLQNTFNAIGALLVVELYYYRYKKHSESGVEHRFKDITNMLEITTPFLKLRDDYYFNNIVS